MMDARRPCPDSALLAAFLDGALADYERTAVVSHLSECPECRAVAVTVVEFREVEALDALWQREPLPLPSEPLFSGGMTRWTREKTRAPALALAAAAALAAVAVPSYFYFNVLFPSWSAQQAVSTLIDAAEAQRPLEARLSGAVAYAPPPSQTSRPALDDRARLQLIATASDIRSTYERDYRTPSRRAVGVAALLTGDLDEAIATLEIAASGAPGDGRIANDLAAAYFERAQRSHRPDDLPAALSAVERSLYHEPDRLEALFNRALIISALGLRAEAETAWHAYLALDATSSWTTEARQRLHTLTSIPVQSDWATIRDAFERNPDDRLALVAVEDHTTASHDYVESVLLNRWLTAAKGGDRGKEEASLARMRLFADAFARHVPDYIYRDFLISLELAHRRGSDVFARSVVAHETFASGMQLMTQQRFQEAASVLARAQAELAAVGSPFSTRAHVEFATLEYYNMRHESAARMLRSLKATAETQHYAMLVTRAAWIQGLVAFEMRDFATAQVNYEQMLSLAAAAGDVDQWLWACGLLANLHDTLGDSARAWQYRIDAASRAHEAFSRGTRAALLASASGDAAAGGYHAAALLFQSVLLSAPSALTPNLEVQVRSQRARSLYALDRGAEAAHELAIVSERLAAVADEASRRRVEADLLVAQAEVFREVDHPRAIAAAERALTLPVTQRDPLRRARVYLSLGEALLQDGQLLRADGAVAAGVDALEEFRATRSAEFALRASDSVWGLYTRAAQIAMRRGDVGRAFAYNERGRVRTPQERRTWGVKTASLDDLQRVLPADTALMVLTQLDDRLQIWVVRRDDVVSHAVAMTATRAAGLVASHLREMIQKTPAPGVSAELYDAVLRPVARAFAGIDKVIVVADAPYNRIAFAGLWDARRDRYVVESHGIVLAPSATAYTWALSRPQQRPRSQDTRRASLLRAAADVTTRSDAVANGLRAVYGAKRIEHAETLTASRFVDAVVRGDVIHIEGKLIPNDQFPNLSSIVVDEEPGRKYSGAVFARSVAETTARAQLVALETSAPAATTALGDGPLGFARALIVAGVPAVVSPVTGIAEASVEQTWVAFHRHYAAGGSAAASLRRAQIQALSESDRRPGPWATLTVFGSAQ